MIFFIMKSIQVGDLRAEINFFHFLQMGEILAILFQLPYAPSMLAKCNRTRRIGLQFATVYAVYASKTHNFTRFCYRMRRVLQQIATVCAVYASNLLQHSPHTLANCYRRRRLCQQFATAYDSKVYTLLFQLPHALSTLAKCYRMRRLRQQFASECAVYVSKLLLHTLAKCYRLRRIRQQFATACAAYACKNSFLHDFASVCAACASNLLA